MEHSIIASSYKQDSRTVVRAQLEVLNSGQYLLNNYVISIIAICMVLHMYFYQSLKKSFTFIPGPKANL